MTARDVIAKAIWAYRDEPATDQADGVIERLAAASEPVRMELATLLNPWRPIETAPKDEICDFWLDWADDCKLLNPPMCNADCYLRGFYGHWASLYKAVKWLPLPAPPSEDKL